MKKEAIDMFTRRKRKIQLVVGLVMFIVGFLIFWNFLQQPITDEQFGLCEKVAQDVAKNLPNRLSNNSFLVDVTDDFRVLVIADENSVSVYAQDFFHRLDGIVAKLKNGTYKFERKNGIFTAIFLSTLCGGSLFFIVGLLIVNKIYGFIKSVPSHH